MWRKRRRRRRRQKKVMRVRFSSVREFLSLHSSPPWGPLSYLSSAHSDRTCIPRGVWRTWRVVYTQRHAARLSGNSPYAHTQTHTHTHTDALHWNCALKQHRAWRNMYSFTAKRRGEGCCCGIAQVACEVQRSL